MIYVIGPRDSRIFHAINTTSRSNNWSKGLSPFFLGPVTLTGANNRVAKNVENAWQFTKVYPEHLENDLPSQKYFNWARAGFQDQKAHRYPMGRGKRPAYSWWNGKKLGYIEARKEIYIPLYSQSVIQTKAFQKLKEKYEEEENVWLWDFDGYNHRELHMSWEDVMDCEHKKMGHVFVLAMMLEGVLAAGKSNDKFAR